MKDRFKIVSGEPKDCMNTLNDWAESMPTTRLKRTQLAAYNGRVYVLVTYEEVSTTPPPSPTKTPTAGQP